MTDTIANLWLKSKPWPIEPPGFVFLARAVDEYGKHLYGALWTGREPIPRYNLLPEFTRENAPPLKSSDIRVVRRFNDLLARKVPNSGRTICALRPAISPPPLSSEEWRAALKLARAEDAPIAEGLKRMRVVAAALQAELIAGKLLSFLRPTRGGDLRGPLPPGMWITENLQNRFSLCQMNPADPFSNGIAGDNFHYVYVDAEGLKKMMAPKTVEHSLLAGLFSLKAEEPVTMSGNGDNLEAPPVQSVHSEENADVESAPPTAQVPEHAGDPKMTNIGRPGKQGPALEAYNKLFPKGHGGMTWKALAREIGKDIGQEVSTTTLKRALADRG